MKMKSWLTIAVVVSISFVMRSPSAAPADKPPTPVKVRPVEAYAINTGVRYSANIKPYTQLELAFKVGGYIETIQPVRGVDGRMRNVQEGDFVKKGTVLARVREADYTARRNQAQAQREEAQSSLVTLKAQVAEAEAAHARAEQDFTRAKNLLESQSLTKADYDAAQAQRDGSQARLDAAKSQIAVVEAKMRGAEALLAEASLALEDTALKMPMDGILMQRLAEVGMLASPGRPAFVVAEINRVKAAFGVPDRVIKNLKLGRFLNISTEAIPSTEFRGQISAISPAADPKSRVFDVEVTIPNPRRLLKPGMIAALTVGETDPAKSMAVIPLSAIVRSKEKPGAYAVFIVEEKDGQPFARSRVVRLGEAFGNTISVLAGVQIGERVITTGATLVVSGDPVRVIP